MENKGVYEFLEEHRLLDPVSFHMPGHKGSRLYKKYGYDRFLNNILDYDITEIPGADNLFLNEGIIKTVMEKYSKLYDVKKTYLLVNGSSSGLIASILATVPFGGKLIMARNSHKSIFNALGLAKITPVYLYPKTIKEYGILGEVDPNEVERLIIENPDVSSVILPSPNYYGICSDVKSIASICHKYGKILIVDQAHGAHLKFFNKYVKGYPLSGENSGADLVINSTHKTLLSLTQSAILNVCSNRVDLKSLEDKLQTIESSSPSYPMMASLEINCDILEKYGEELIKAWDNNLNKFYNRCEEIKDLVILKDKMLDKTKINFDMSKYGYNGDEVEIYLNSLGVFTELVTGNIVMGMSGIGNNEGDFNRLFDCLKDLEKKSKGKIEEKVQPKALTNKLDQVEIPIVKEYIPLVNAKGRVCGKSVIPYPPGIPVVCPGEIFDSEVINYIIQRRDANEKVLGVSSDGMVCVGK